MKRRSFLKQALVASTALSIPISIIASKSELLTEEKITKIVKDVFFGDGWFMTHSHHEAMVAFRQEQEALFWHERFNKQ